MLVRVAIVEMPKFAPMGAGLCLWASLLAGPRGSGACGKFPRVPTHDPGANHATAVVAPRWRSFSHQCLDPRVFGRPERAHDGGPPAVLGAR